MKRLQVYCHNGKRAKKQGQKIPAQELQDRPFQKSPHPSLRQTNAFGMQWQPQTKHRGTAARFPHFVFTPNAMPLLSKFMPIMVSAPRNTKLVHIKSRFLPKELPGKYAIKICSIALVSKNSIILFTDERNYKSCVFVSGTAFFIYKVRTNIFNKLLFIFV